ncbi:hypothetical protein HJC23_003534 [Cyclotella cryptica]|uniref:peptidyl-tRNA hydrolase n=1 Tax=Cyclotella cryptica TaxID=29204 RepID=A0ABD3P050_9STRA|eukprot:CCRYP_018589-RA/>CCRYP_018589-RA protein AED:0.24 eAED:0.24 QI:0/0/0.5/1/0/0/2/201/195
MATVSLQQSPFAYFLAGLLVSATYFYLTSSPTLKTFDREEQAKIEGNWDEADSDDEDHDSNHPLFNKDNPSSSWGYRDAPYKMVLCVNQDLGMGKGKIAAQCGHAAVGCYKRARRQCPSALSAWERTGCAKIAVKCPDEEEMSRIFDLAVQKGIPLYLVEDAGRTQIAAGSRTVLGLGPAPVRVFEGVTSHLNLM